MPVVPHDPDYNPYCLTKRYLEKMPKRIAGGQPCMEEFGGYFDCLMNARFDKGQCEEANRMVLKCMKADKFERKSSFQYHVFKMIKNKYRIPVLK